MPGLASGRAWQAQIGRGRGPASKPGRFFNITTTRIKISEYYLKLTASYEL
jgi:hypothetical protein